MSYGPIELFFITFPKNRFHGEILTELKNLVNDGIIRVIDILLVRKDKAGDVTVTEVTEVEDEDSKAFGVLISDVAGLLNEKDAVELAKQLKKDSAAGIMLVENTWAKDLADAIDRAGGQVALSERIPRAVVEELVASAQKE